MSRSPQITLSASSGSGFSQTDLLVLFVAIILLAALALPALSQARDEAKITTCANNLKQLAEADLKYANEFNGKFFYDWDRHYSPQGEGKPNWQARWWDKERVGRYVPGVSMQRVPSFIQPMPPDPRNLRAADPSPFISNIGLGGVVFACPADEGAMRSYHQNFWASGVEVSTPELEQVDPTFKRPIFPGEFFDARDAVAHDRLILFGEMLAIYPARHGDNQPWNERVTGDEFGSKLAPSNRFSGATSMGDRYGGGMTPVYPVQIDYARHSDQRISPSGMLRPTTTGGINFAYADGHVAWREHSDLYDPQTRQSTYQTLWSPIDKKVDGMLNW